MFLHFKKEKRKKRKRKRNTFFPMSSSPSNEAGFLKTISSAILQITKLSNKKMQSLRSACEASSSMTHNKNQTPPHHTTATNTPATPLIATIEHLAAASEFKYSFHFLQKISPSFCVRAAFHCVGLFCMLCPSLAKQSRHK